MLHRVLRGGWALLFCLGLCGCPQSAENETDEQKNPHYVAGKQKADALDFKGAIASFERAVEDNPRSVLAHYELGVLYENRENDYAAALYHYNKALKLRPNAYPADNIQQRIPGCRQELVKADSLDIVNPTMLRETARLREENQSLRKQVESLSAQLTGRPAAGTSALAAGTAGTAGGPARFAAPAATNRADASRSASATRSRSHVVKSRETLAGIARLYGMRLDALLAANPGLDPRKLKVGQSLNLPAP